MVALLLTQGNSALSRPYEGRIDGPESKVSKWNDGHHKASRDGITLPVYLTAMGVVGGPEVGRCHGDGSGWHDCEAAVEEVMPDLDGGFWDGERGGDASKRD